MEEATTKLAQINKTNADNLLAEQKHQELLNGSVKVSDTVLSATVSLIKYLEGHVTKTQVINQLESIATPDALEVIPHIEALHSTLKGIKQPDLSGLLNVLNGLLDETKKIPKELPKAEKQQFVDYSDQFKSLKEAIVAVGKFVKDQKTVIEAPIVNVEAPDVNIPPVDLSPLQDDIRDVVSAVKKIVIPEYKTDTEAVQKLIKTSNTLLKKLLDKPVSSGGGGGGRATPYQDSNSIPAFVTINPDGSLPVSDTSLPTANNNPSLVLGYTDNKLTTLTKTIGAVSYQKTLSYTGTDLTGVSVWVEV